MVAETPKLWPPDENSQLAAKALILGKIEGARIRGKQTMRQLDSITDSMEMNLGKFWEIVEDKGAWYAEVHRVTKSRRGLGD